MWVPMVKYELKLLLIVWYKGENVARVVSIIRSCRFKCDKPVGLLAASKLAGVSLSLF